MEQTRISGRNADVSTVMIVMRRCNICRKREMFELFILINVFVSVLVLLFKLMNFCVRWKWQESAVSWFRLTLRSWFLSTEHEKIYSCLYLVWKRAKKNFETWKKVQCTTNKYCVIYPINKKKSTSFPHKFAETFDSVQH